MLGVMVRLGRNLVIAGVLASAPLAWAHAVLLEGSPRPGATVIGPSIPLTLRFNSRIDGKRSRLTATGANGKDEALGIAPQTKPDTLSAEIKGARPGRCRIRWQVLASDGHITRGELVFQVQ